MVSRGNNDTVYSSIDFDMNKQCIGNVETVFLTGTADLDASGDDGDFNSLIGNTGENILRGNGGTDRLDGRGGADVMIGGDGYDTYHVDSLFDIVDESGTTGPDVVFASVSFNLVDAAHAKGSIEELYLDGSAITGIGSDLANFILGSDSKNILNGNGGDDLLQGDFGADKLTGGSGADTFRYTLTSDSYFAVGQRDVIRDFSAAEGDRINISWVGSEFTRPERQPHVFIGTANFTGHAGEVGYAVANGDAYLYADTNGDAKADFSIVLENVTSLQASDFIL